jgi:hypothetical protein
MGLVLDIPDGSPFLVHPQFINCASYSVHRNLTIAPSKLNSKNVENQSENIIQDT